MISHSSKFIFVHIPKVGGTSIMHTLRPFNLIGVGHSTLQQIQNKTYPKLSNEQLKMYYKFAAVRNPWDIVVSHYSYSKMKKSFWHSQDRTTKYGEHPDYNLTNRVDFKEFVQLLVDGKINNPIAKIRQSHWLDNRLDFLIRFENLHDDFQKVCVKIGKPQLRLEKINPSSHRHYSTYYDEETKDLVANYYAGDIEKLGYSFETE